MTITTRFLLWGLCCCLAACSSAPSAEEKKQNKPVKRAVPVAAALAERRDVRIVLSAVGNVESYATVAVKTRVTGEVQTVHFKDGQDVAEGEPLFTLDKRPFEAALREARAKLERDKTLSAKADDDVRRFNSLVSKGFVSVEQYDNFKSLAEALHSSIRANEGVEEKAALDLEYCSIRAPMAGRTGQIFTTRGAMIKSTDDKPMVVIDRVQPIYVTFSVPEKHLPAIQDRLRLGRPAVSAKPPEAPYDPEQGELSFLDSNVDMKTGAIKLKATFTNTQRRLWPGQFVDVALDLGVEKDMVVVPAQAVQNGIEGPYAFVVAPDKTVVLRQVKSGRTVGGLTVVLSGVAAGERVVTDGQLRLVPGAPVEIKGDTKTDATHGAETAK